ncbi:hypothetical protein GCM10018954_062630 [Kutzneria kofuensis]
MAQDDFDGWKQITDAIGDRCQLVGDDLYCTNVELLRKGIDLGITNSILVKVNQIGTLTETLLTVNTAFKAGYSVVMSHRSGETEDSTIADLAVAVNCGRSRPARCPGPTGPPSTTSSSASSRSWARRPSTRAAPRSPAAAETVGSGVRRRSTPDPTHGHGG